MLVHDMQRKFPSLIHFSEISLKIIVALKALTSVPKPLKKLSICTLSASETSDTPLVSKLKLSNRKSKLSRIKDFVLRLCDSICQSWSWWDASQVSEPSDMSLDGVLLSLIEFKRRRI